MFDLARTHALPRNRSWWDNAVVYQIYVRSFADGDGDGIGDLAGITARLDHLTDLGVDALWLNPCYPSPQADQGYDIADFFDVNPEYGDLAALDALLAAAHARGLRVLLDLVPNHCSSEHPWFTAALAAPAGSAERARFHFRDGRGASGELPPNNWAALFGGPAWTRVTEPDGSPGQWYLHLFTPQQPDFNWADPETVAYFDEVLRFWFDRGVDGFRIDVAHGLFKDPGLRDWTEGGYNRHAWNQDQVHAIYRRWRAIADGYGPDHPRMFVGEIWTPVAEDMAEYLRPDELHQAFHFDLLTRSWNAAAVQDSVRRARRTAISGNSTAWTLNNHDVFRAVTRYGVTRPAPPIASSDPFAALMRPRGEVDLELGERRARAALLLMLALPGTAYLYQGEELGLPEVLDIAPEDRHDPVFARHGAEDVGRDGCRVPIPWTSDGPSFGFSSGPNPWLPQPSWFAGYSVEAQQSEAGSTLNLYRAALAIRRDLQANGGRATWADVSVDRKGPLLFVRGGSLACVTNFSKSAVAFDPPDGVLALSSAPRDDEATIPPDTSLWFARS
ncbi:alpha-glucosidase [Amycolatopsis xylanica]|uniref:Alpha-glucosidase n=1 Tax=Amycolatopsis xylanica TaxID=589385 RepID=A0A1H3SB40_9PSEU|nr:glycoside hydrolase family 13 protein [Amycolatopsis xylanica]SDZ35144.1 alpha-glucosidase [Amycolatopsis xylanica]